jgi:hypothetical protein
MQTMSRYNWVEWKRRKREPLNEAPNELALKISWKIYLRGRKTRLQAQIWWPFAIKKSVLIIMCDMPWYRKNDMSWHQGEMFYGSIYATHTNYKTCYIYGTKYFCTAPIKYLKLCSTFSLPYSKSWHPYCNEYIIVSNPTQSNSPFYKIGFHLSK